MAEIGKLHNRALTQLVFDYGRDARALERVFFPLLKYLPDSPATAFVAPVLASRDRIASCVLRAPHSSSGVANLLQLVENEPIDVSARACVFDFMLDRMAPTDAALAIKRAIQMRRVRADWGPHELGQFERAVLAHCVRLPKGLAIATLADIASREFIGVDSAVTIANILGEHGDASAEPALLQLLEEGTRGAPNLTDAAAHALAKVGGMAALSALADHQMRRHRDSVHDALEHLRAKFGGEAGQLSISESSGQSGGVSVADDEGNLSLDAPPRDR
jgi:hypothetical protein